MTQEGGFAEQLLRCGCSWSRVGCRLPRESRHFKEVPPPGRRSAAQRRIKEGLFAGTGNSGVPFPCSDSCSGEGGGDDTAGTGCETRTLPPPPPAPPVGPRRHADSPLGTGSEVAVPRGCGSGGCQLRPGRRGETALKLAAIPFVWKGYREGREDGGS